jgi:transcriptional regulator with XRE-family HTH domain
MSIGDRLRQLRLRDRQSLQQVAEAIGASKAHIWELENGRSENPSLNLLRGLAAHFRTTVTYLVEDPVEEASQAREFFRRNRHKLETLGEAEMAVIEQLLDLIIGAPPRS